MTGYINIYACMYIGCSIQCLCVHKPNMELYTHSSQLFDKVCSRNTAQSVPSNNNNKKLFGI